MKFEQFCQYVGNKQGVVFHTLKQKKAFTTSMDDTYLHITPLSSGKDRHMKLSTLKEMFSLNQTSGSYITSHYTDITLHSSYVLSLLDSFYGKGLGFELYQSIDDESAIEGYKLDSGILRTARNQKLTKEAKERDSYTCQACGYIKVVNGRHIIDCHHKNPLSSTGEVKTSLDSLVCLCPNCHRIAHLKTPPYEVSELKRLVFA